MPELLVPGNRLLYCLDTAGVERWRFEPASQYFPSVSSPLAADIDNDGETDVVVATPLAVYRLSAGGDSVWRRTLSGQGSVQNCIASCALGDINGDSKLEVFCHEVYANRLLCLDPETGEEVRAFHPGRDARFSVGTPTVADLDRDGRFEVVGVVTDSSGGRTYCLDDSGRARWEFRTPCTGLSGWQLASVAAADEAGDDRLEVIGTANYWGIFCLDCRGETLWTRRFAEHAATCPAIGDVGNDGALEVVSAFGPSMDCLDARTGSTKWQFSVASGYYIVSSPCLCDLDRDSRLETVFAEVKQSNPSDSLRPMWVLDHSGVPVWFDTVGTTMSDPVAADLDQDGRMEFCIGPTYRGYRFWRFEADTAGGGVFAWTNANPVVRHNLVSGNSAQHGSGTGCWVSSVRPPTAGLGCGSYTWTTTSMSDVRECRDHRRVHGLPNPRREHDTRSGRPCTLQEDLASDAGLSSTSQEMGFQLDMARLARYNVIGVGEDALGVVLLAGA